MKRFCITFLALALASMSVSAKGNGTPDEKIATWSSAQEYSSILVKDDINVILVEAPTKTITIEGPDELVDAVKFEIRKGELRVSSSKRAAGKERVTIIIPVQTLNSLTVRGTSNVTSQELVSSPTIKVKITGTGQVSLKTKGKVVVDTDENHDYIYNSNNKVESNKQ